MHVKFMLFVFRRGLHLPDPEPNSSRISRWISRWALLTPQSSPTSTPHPSYSKDLGLYCLLIYHRLSHCRFLAKYCQRHNGPRVYISEMGYKHFSKTNRNTNTLTHKYITDGKKILSKYKQKYKYFGTQIYHRWETNTFQIQIEIQILWHTNISQMGNTPSWQTNPRLICRCSRQCHCLIKYILKQIFKNISFINFEDKSPGLRRYAYMWEI